MPLSISLLVGEDPSRSSAILTPTPEASAPTALLLLLVALLGGAPPARGGDSTAAPATPPPTTTPEGAPPLLLVPSVPEVGPVPVEFGPAAPAPATKRHLEAIPDIQK